jgi:hypothetical protein
MFVSLAILLIPNMPVYSETVHQTVEGVNANTGDGGVALAKNVTEAMTTPADAGSTKVARVKSSMVQWGYITFWFGVPVPAGNVVARFKVYVDGSDTADYALYTNAPNAHDTIVGHLLIPADAKKNTFVDVNVPISSTAEWSGLILKKAEVADKPSPWISSVSIVLP